MERPFVVVATTARAPLRTPAARPAAPLTGAAFLVGATLIAVRLEPAAFFNDASALRLLLRRIAVTKSSFRI
ncbi:MAG: hypothetical protein QM811_10425 [Pirellulales bacterium]